MNAELLVQRLRAVMARPDRDGIAVRAGHHCAQPLHEKFGIQSTTRASFYLYSTKSEVDALIEGIYKVKKVFG